MSREERRAFIEVELQKRWRAILAALDEKLSSVPSGVIGQEEERSGEVAERLA